MDRKALEHVANLFGVFADATRLSILLELKAGPLSVGELVKRLKLTQGNVSKQLKILSDHGLLDRQRTGSKVFYSIADEMIFPLCNQVCDKLNRDQNRDANWIYQI